MKTPITITRRVVLANTLAFVATFLLIACGLYFVDQRDADRQRDICGLIDQIDVPVATPTPAPTPSTPASASAAAALERQRRILAALHAYRLQIGCDKVRDTP